MAYGTADTTPEIVDVLAGYDVTASTTFLQLSTCQADKNPASGITIVTAYGEISSEDWAAVFTRFPLRTDEYDFDFTIHDDGLEVFMLAEIGDRL